MGLIQILYKGVVLTQIPVSISLQGHLIKAALSGAGSQELQVCHMWKQSKVGASDMGGTSQNSETDGTLQVRYVPSSADELLEGDFITLEHVAIFNIKSTNDGEVTIIPSSPFSIGLTFPETTGETTLSIVGFAPLLIVPAISPSTGTLSFVGRMPNLTNAITPDAGSLSFTSTAPTSFNTITPTVASLGFMGAAPTILTSMIQPSVATLALTTTAPIVSTPLYAPSTGSLSLTSTAASLRKNTIITPSVRSMTFTGNTAFNVAEN